MDIKTRDRVNKVIMYVILIIMAFIMLVPFVWMILTAVKTNQEAISVDPFFIFPQNGWHWENFITVWKSYNFIILYKNTLLMIFFRVVCAVLTATMAGYAFGRLATGRRGDCLQHRPRLHGQGRSRSISCTNSLS